MPYKPTNARQCRLGKTRSAGPGSVLGVWVVGTRCRSANALVRLYQRCLNSAAGRKARCYGRVERRCVRPTFLGPLPDARPLLPPPRPAATGAPSGALYPVRGLYEGRGAAAASGPTRISTATRCFPRGPVAVGTESELRAAWGNPRVTSIHVTRDLLFRHATSATRSASRAGPVLLDGTVTR